MQKIDGLAAAYFTDFRADLELGDISECQDLRFFIIYRKALQILPCFQHRPTRLEGVSLRITLKNVDAENAIKFGLCALAKRMSDMLYQHIRRSDGEYT